MDSSPYIITFGIRVRHMNLKGHKHSSIVLPYLVLCSICCSCSLFPFFSFPLFSVFCGFNYLFILFILHFVVFLKILFIYSFIEMQRERESSRDTGRGRSRLPQYTEALALDLGLPSLQECRNKCLLFKLFSMWYFLI